MTQLTGFKNLKQLILYFSDEDKCRDYLEAARWSGCPICPHCGSYKWWKIKNTPRYKCGECKKKYSVTVGTVMDNSNIPLSTWFMAIYVISSHKTGISSVQLAKDVGITQKSAWFLLHRIREMFKEENSLLTGMVEVDEVYIGGKDRKQRKKGLKPGRGAVNKVPVLGLLQREGKVIYRVLSDTREDTVKPIIREIVDKGATINTDGHLSYTGLLHEFAGHEVVHHAAGEYARGLFHTNSVEGAFGMLRRGIRGIYVKMSIKHLHRYCQEFSFRWNTRGLSEVDRFEQLLGRTDGKLTYKILIDKK